MRIRNQTTVLRTLLVLAALALVAAVPATAEIERSFDTGGGGALKLSADGASVTVETNNGNTTTVLIERRRGSERIENDFDVSFDHDGRDLVVRIEKRDKINWGRNNGLKVTVALPQQFDLDISTSGGSLAVTDLDGEIVARTSGGSISLGRVEGTVDAKSSGGSINLESSSVSANLSTSGGGITAGDVAGTVKARTSGGSIQIDRADGDIDVSTSGGSIRLGEIAGSIDAKTSGGSITATFTKQPSNDSELSTSGGSVRVSVASGIGFDLDARSSSGVTTDVPIQVRGKIERSQVQGTVNGGGPALVLRASGGRIVISES